MASIITATTTSGLTQEADNSGVLQLASGTGNLVTIPSVTGTAMVSGNMPAFSAYMSGTLSVSTSTNTKIPINTEEWDTANCFDTSTYRFTPNVAGYYQVQGAIFISPPNNTSGFILSIFKNGNEYKQIHRDQYEVNFNQLACGSTVVDLNGSTDYIELYVWQNGGTTQTFGQSSSGTTWFSGTMIRGA